MLKYNDMNGNPNQQINRQFIRSIKKAVPKHCSNCGHKYTENDLTLIQKDEYAAVFHLTCQKCKESYLINVVSPFGNLQGSSRLPLKLDISSAEEARKFIGKNSVSSDDVLNLHELLEKLKNAEDLKNLIGLENKS